MKKIFQRFFLSLILAILFYGCSCGTVESSRLRLRVDPNWYPLDFGAQQPHVNGFVEELLLDIAAYSGLEFELVKANWDSLLDDMHQKKYDAALSSLSPHNFNLAKYDFSEKFLELGPVLIVPIDSSRDKLEEMKGELVGLLAGDSAFLILQKHPDVILRTYESIPDLLDALVQGEINGAILNRILAFNYIKDLYSGKLMIVGASMTDEGLRLIALKGKHPSVIRTFNKSLQFFKNKKKIKALLEKWDLG